MKKSDQEAGVCAAIDIGSNTIRLLVASPAAHGREAAPISACGNQTENRGLSFLHTRLETTRLASGLREGGGLDAGAARRSLEVLRSYLDDIRRSRAAWVVAVGTGALRDARDGARFAEDVRRRTGLAISIIDQSAEARLTLLGVQSVLGASGALAVADIGGRSTEVILRRGGGSPEVFGFQLGVVNLSEDFVVAGSPGMAGLDPLFRHLESVLAASPLPRPLPREVVLAGCGGTFTTLAALDLGLREYRRERINRHRLTTVRVEELLRRMAALDQPARQALPGMAPDRADIILPGAVLVLSLLKSLNRGDIVVSDAGILEGCILAGLRGEFPA